MQPIVDNNICCVPHLSVICWVYVHTDSGPMSKSGREKMTFSCGYRSIHCFCTLCAPILSPEMPLWLRSWSTMCLLLIYMFVIILVSSCSQLQVSILPSMQLARGCLSPLPTIHKLIIGQTKQTSICQSLPEKSLHWIAHLQKQCHQVDKCTCTFYILPCYFTLHNP
jgi:hypothetical protein